MTNPTPGTLADYLALQYTFNVIADPDGGYVIVYPDLPGCLTQVEVLEEIPEMAEEARQLWIETAYEDGQQIPLPSYPEEYSGKFVVRLPKSLHRSLAESAEREGVSLNQHVVTLLSRGDALARIETRLDDLGATVSALQKTLRVHVSGMRLDSPRRTAALSVVGEEALAA